MWSRTKERQLLCDFFVTAAVTNENAFEIFFGYIITIYSYPLCKITVHIEGYGPCDRLVIWRKFSESAKNPVPVRVSSGRM